MKLDYLELISPEPFVIQNVGSIKPHTLRDISRLTHRIYSTYIALLNISPEKYCTEINKNLKTWYESLDEEQSSLLSMYDIAVSTKDLQLSFSAILNFFFVENVIYHPEKDAFIVFGPSKSHEGETASIVGTIDKNNYSDICNIILQLNHIDTGEDIDLSKVKNKKGLARYMEMQKHKKQYSKKPKSDSNLDLGNIISAVCVKHNSINYTNVWDMTVYQLWDTFTRLRNNDIYELNKTAVSVWGDKEKKFDFDLWYKNII